METENFLKIAKMTPTSCSTCKGKTKVDESRLNETKLDDILSKLDSISASIEAKSLPQIVFVKAQPGLGFNENESNSRDP